MAKDQVVKQLRSLQGLARRKPSRNAEHLGGSFQVPDDLAGDGFRMVTLLKDETAAIVALMALLAEDLRFEHLAPPEAQQALHRFIARALIDTTTDEVAGFVEQHAKVPQTVRCCFPIRWLTVTGEFAVAGVQFVSREQAPLAGPPFVGVSEQVTAVAVAEATGTDSTNMVARARQRATYALRLLRLSLSDDRWTTDEQLRFRLGETFWVAEGGSGWQSDPTIGWGLELSAEEANKRLEAPIVGVPGSGGTRLDAQVRLATEWFERAQLTPEPVIATLYLFFALEAILSLKQDRLKAGQMAVRRAVLGSEVAGGFSHPARIYELYDQVRSAAVHGEQVPQVDEKVVTAFAGDVRRALDEYVALAKERRVTRRSQLLKILDQSPSRAKIVAGLKGQAPAIWAELDEVT